MTVTVLLEVTAKPEHTEDLIAWFAGNFKQTRVREGCIDIYMTRSQEDPNALAIIQVWEQRPDFESYLQWRADTGGVEKLMNMAAGEPIFRYFDRLDA